MRVDEAHHVLGLRLNVWTAIGVFVLAVTYFVISARIRPGREEIVEPDLSRDAAKADPAEGTTDDDAASDDTLTGQDPDAPASGTEDDGAAQQKADRS